MSRSKRIQVPCLHSIRLLLLVTMLGYSANALSSVDELLSLFSTNNCQAKMATALNATSSFYSQAGMESSLALINTINTRLYNSRFIVAFQKNLSALEAERIKKPAQFLSLDARLRVFEETWSEIYGSDLYPIAMHGDFDVRNIQITSKGETQNQSSPLRELLFPFISTGAFIPKKNLYNPKLDVVQNKPDVVMIMLPGYGPESTAKSGMFMLSRLSSGKGEFIADVNQDGRSNKKLQTLPVLLDSSLGGLGSDSPDFFLNPNFSNALLAHVVRLFSLVFSDTKIIIAGKSHGALQALNFANNNESIAGIIAVNPANPSASYDTSTAAWQRYSEVVTSFKIPDSLLVPTRIVTTGEYLREEGAFIRSLINSYSGTDVGFENFQRGTDIWSSAKDGDIFNQVSLFMTQFIVNEVLND